MRIPPPPPPPLAALFPALLGLCFGLFVIPPRMGFDAAFALPAWFHFQEGGTWNTILIPDPNDISQSVESPVSWWPPGQYLLLGIFHSVGFSFGTTALIFSFITTLSASIGMAAFARSLEAPVKSLPWISYAVSCSYYNFINFSHFQSGEPLTLALWPWVTLVAWKFRKRNFLLIPILPVLFLLGSFFKHSFAIYALCILAFLWSENIRERGFTLKNGIKSIIKDLLEASLPLVSVGFIYIAIRHYCIDTSATPATGRIPNHFHFSLQETLGFVSVSPLLSIYSISSILDKLVHKFSLSSPSEAISSLYCKLAFVFPLFIYFYISLSKSKDKITRFSGLTSLILSTLYFIFHSLDLAISQENRHYQQAGLLLLTAIAVKSSNNNRLGLFLKIATIAMSIAGLARVAQNSYIYTKPDSGYSIGHERTSVRVPKIVLDELSLIISSHPNSIFGIVDPELLINIEKHRPQSTRFLNIYYAHAFELENYTLRGRVRKIIIPTPAEYYINESSIKSRFIDYTEDEWTSYGVGNWIIIQTKDDIPELRQDT